MFEVQVAPGIISCCHVNKLRPTAVGPDTVKVSEPVVVSLPSVPIQKSVPAHVVGSILEMLSAHQPEMDSVPVPTAISPQEVTPVSS